MKKLRILFAVLLCATLFQSCTTEDIIVEDEKTTVLQQDIINAREGDTTIPDTGDDEIEDDDDTPD